MKKVSIADSRAIALLVRQHWLEYALKPAWCHLYAEALIALDVRRRKLVRGNFISIDPSVEAYWSENEREEYEFSLRTGICLSQACAALGI